MIAWKSSPIKANKDSLIRGTIKGFPTGSASELDLRASSDNYERILKAASAMFDDDQDNTPVRTLHPGIGLARKFGVQQGDAGGNENKSQQNEITFSRSDIVHSSFSKEKEDKEENEEAADKSSMEPEADVNISIGSDAIFEGIRIEHEPLQPEYASLEPQHDLLFTGNDIDLTGLSEEKEKWSKYSEDAELMGYTSFLIKLNEEFGLDGPNAVTMSDANLPDTVTAAQEVERLLRDHLSIPLATLQMSVLNSHTEFVNEGIFDMVESV